MLVHFGSHSGSTAGHLADAAAELGYGTSLERREGEHLLLTQIHGLSAYLWVESGIRSLPLDTHAADVPTAGYLIDSHLHLEQTRLQAALFDAVFVAQRDFIPAIREVNPNVYWLPLAAPRSFVDLTREDVYAVAFVGAVPRYSFRERLLTEINSRVAMNDWRRPYSVEAMGDVYRRSRIVLNPPARGDLNMRFFEGMACGAVVVTPLIGNGVEAVAKEGEHYLATHFREPQSVAEYVLAILKTDTAEIGMRARNLVASGHTYHHRITAIKEVLGSTQPVAPVRSMPPRERARHLLRLAETYGDTTVAAHALRGAGVDGQVFGHAVRTTGKSIRRWVGRQFRHGVQAILDHRVKRVDQG